MRIDDMTRHFNAGILGCGSPLSPAFLAEGMCIELPNRAFAYSYPIL